jgi:dimethylargininase
MLIAFTRAVSPLIEQCELTHLARTRISFEQAVAEHHQYENVLRRLGCRVERLPDAPELPDSVFVEDTAVVFDDVAVIARPGAASRQAEVDAMADVLQRYRRVEFIEPPGTLDGGDVLVTPGRVFVGRSGRTNEEGVRQLASHIAPFGFDVVGIPVTGCLHLKSAVTLLGLPPKGGSHAAETMWPPPTGGRQSLLINPEWIDPKYFDGFELIEIDPVEPAAANVLRVGDTVISAAEFPHTRRRLEAKGLVTASVPAGELAKAEGGVTCCSVLVTIRE